MDDWVDRAMELPGAKRYERYVSALCPFHSDTKPSLLVFEDGFVCLACGERGSLERLFHLKVSSGRVSLPAGSYLPKLPDLPNSILARDAHEILVSSPGLQDYLVKRGLDEAIVPCMLGYWDGWYTVPVTSQDGEVSEILFRSNPKIQELTGSRFYQRPHQKPMMYVPDWSTLNKPYLLLPFGLFDAITLYLAGFPAVTSTSGKDSFRPEWLDWWSGFILIIPDLLEEPEAHKLASKLGWRGRVVELDYPDNCKDPNDLWKIDRNLLIRTINESIRNISDRNWIMSQA